MTVRYSLGEIGRLRGKANETKVHTALTILSMEEPWIESFRRASIEEEARGIDFVIVAKDIGNLYLQVKSSRTGIRKAKEKRRGALIGYVRVSDNNPINRVRSSLSRLRAQVVKIRKMADTIIKLDGKYLIWSSIVDAPTTYGMTKKELTAYIKEEHGQRGLDTLPSRIARTEMKGTSSHLHDSVDDLIATNRAGPNETQLTKKQLIDYYVKRIQNHPKESR